MSCPYLGGGRKQIAHALIISSMSSWLLGCWVHGLLPVGCLIDSLDSIFLWRGSKMEDGIDVSQQLMMRVGAVDSKGNLSMSLSAIVPSPRRQVALRSGHGGPILCWDKEKGEKAEKGERINDTPALFWFTNYPRRVINGRDTTKWRRKRKAGCAEAVDERGHFRADCKFRSFRAHTHLVSAGQLPISVGVGGGMSPFLPHDSGLTNERSL